MLEKASQCSSVILYWASFRINFLIGMQNYVRSGQYLFRKFTNPRHECLASLSAGNSILRIELIFFRSGEIPVEFHVCPKNDTS